MTKRKPWLNGKPLLLSTNQVGNLLGTRTDTVRRWIYNGDLKAVHLNQRNKVTPKALYDFLIARGLEDIATTVYTPPPRPKTWEEMWTPDIPDLKDEEGPVPPAQEEVQKEVQIPAPAPAPAQKPVTAAPVPSPQLQALSQDRPRILKLVRVHP